MANIFDMIREQENIPNYYQFETDNGEKFDVFKLVRWIKKKIPDFSFEKANALKYQLRIKGDKAKLIDDIKKAINCLKSELVELESSNNSDKGKEPIDLKFNHTIDDVPLSLDKKIEFNDEYARKRT